MNTSRIDPRIDVYYTVWEHNSSGFGTYHGHSVDKETAVSYAKHIGGSDVAYTIVMYHGPERPRVIFRKNYRLPRIAFNWREEGF